MKETKETYQVWFRDCKDYCVNYSEELDDAIEMANIGDAYNMEGMEYDMHDGQKYLDWIDGLTCMVYPSDSDFIPM